MKNKCSFRLWICKFPVFESASVGGPLMGTGHPLVIPRDSPEGPSAQNRFMPQRPQGIRWWRIYFFFANSYRKQRSCLVSPERCKHTFLFCGEAQDGLAKKNYGAKLIPVAKLVIVSPERISVQTCSFFLKTGGIILEFWDKDD